MARGRSSAATEGSTATATPAAPPRRKIRHGGDGRLEIVEQAFGDRKKIVAGSRQRDRPGAAIEQPDPEVLFQLADVQAQTRLRQAEPLGRAGEVSRARYGDEDAQLVQVDVHPGPSFIEFFNQHI